MGIVVTILLIILAILFTLLMGFIALLHLSKFISRDILGIEDNEL